MVISHNSKTEDIVQLLRDDNIAMENVKILNRDQRTIKKENETRKNWIYECNEQRFERNFKKKWTSKIDW